MTPVPVFLPSDRAWMDPRLVGANMYTQMTDTLVSVSVATLVAPANPYRWAVGFVLAPPVLDGARVAPYPDVGAGSGTVIRGDSILWFYLTQHGTLVQGQWWAIDGTFSVCRTIEILRNSEVKPNVPFRLPTRKAQEKPTTPDDQRRYGGADPTLR